MQNYLTVLIIIISCTSCGKKRLQEKIYRYHYIKAGDNLGLLKYSDSIILESKIKNDSIRVTKNNQVIFNSQISLDSFGIYYKIRDEKYILYPFQDTNEIIRYRSQLVNVFPSVRLVGIKNYNIEALNYTVFHFVENGFDMTLDSYYLKGEGFICFYKYADNYFAYLKSSAAEKVANKLLNDTSFFAYLKLKQADIKMGRKF